MTPQTRFHRHWQLPVRKGSLVYKVLRYPLTTTTFEKASKSRLVWGAESMDSKVWSLSLLGLLHTATGLTLTIKPERYRCVICQKMHPVGYRHG